VFQDLSTRALVAAHAGLHRVPWLHRRLVAARNRAGFERRVTPAVLSVVRAGDCVWDVGANVGYYTTRFLDRVGPDGVVVAFEPLPELAARLEEQAAGDARLRVQRIALADFDGSASFAADGPDGENSSLGDRPGAFEVRVARGDAITAEGVPAPDVVKIDVEGFERDVLEGMPETLRRARALLVEMHFQAMLGRGRGRDALRIRDLLHGQGFEVRWVDSSHLLATR